MVCDQNPVFWILKHIQALLCFVVFLCFYYVMSLLRFFLLVFKFLCFAGEWNFEFGCDVLVRVFVCYVL
jgi:hypothetical protein